MSEDMKQPKFKFGQKVKSRDDVFIITGIEWDGTHYCYYSDGAFVVIEPGLTEVKEPLAERDKSIREFRDTAQGFADELNVKDAKIAELEKECESAKELLQKADGALSFFDNDKSSPLMWEIFDFLKPKETP